MERGLNAARGGEPGRRRSRPALGGQLREPQVCAPPVRVGGGLLCVESPHGALQAVGPQRLVPAFALAGEVSGSWTVVAFHRPSGAVGLPGSERGGHGRPRSARAPAAPHVSFWETRERLLRAALLSQKVWLKSGL